MTGLPTARFAGPPERHAQLSGLLDGLVADGDSPAVVYDFWPTVSRKGLLGFHGAEEGGDVPYVVVLGGGLPKPYLARVMCNKIDGIVLEADAERSLRATVQAVLAGQRVYPLAFKQMLDAPVLSSREKQILAMVILDMPNAEIAARLHVTESNVKGHLSSAFGKLGVASRSAASALVLDPEAGLGPGILRITPSSETVE